LVVAVLAVLLMIIEDLRVYHTTIELNNASRAGAQYAIHSPANASNLQDMEQAALNDGPDTSGITAVASEHCGCFDSYSALCGTAGACQRCARETALLTFLHSLRLVAPTAHSCGLSNNLSQWSGLW
jgi:hypothetical protein